MNSESVKKWVQSQRIFVSSLKTEELLESSLTIKKPKRGFFSFLWEGWKSLDEINYLGGIITGDIALSLYHKNGKSLIVTNQNKWEMILERDKFFQFCIRENLRDFEHSDGCIICQFKKGTFMGTSMKKNPINIEFENLYILSHDIKILGLNKIPEYIEVKNWRLDKLENILESKLKQIEYDSKYSNNVKLLEKIDNFNNIINNLKQ